MAFSCEGPIVLVSFAALSREVDTGSGDESAPKT